MKMIVIGGSSGGLAPLKVILRDLPEGLDAAVLVLRHSWPSIPSQLATLLRPLSALPIEEVVEGTVARAAHVYVAPSGTNVTLAGRDGAAPLFELAPCSSEPGRGRPSIDVALASAAHLFGTDCIGVILSGYLDDGTEGAIEVGACDGVIIAQAPSDAEQASMPLNVVVRDSPNYILPDVQIAGTLSALVRGFVPGDEAIPVAS